MNEVDFEALLRPGDAHAARCPLTDERWDQMRQSLHLTQRELQIIQFLFDGQQEASIARSLGISPHTVHTHMGRLYKKLEVDSCRGLLLRVFQAYVAGDARKPATARRA